VLLRTLAEADLEIIRLLRNRHRHAFFDDREITPDAQRQWFASLPGRSVEFFVIEEGGTVIGTISVTTSAAGKEVGNLLLNTAYRGRGLMQRAVAQVTAAPARYVAHVKAGNTPSLRVFRAAGFSERATSSDVLFEKTVA
jgi:RimJ/RimL family protein N-acetyltransferase